MVKDETAEIIVNIVRMIILVTIFSSIFYFVTEKITISIVAGITLYLAWK